MGQQLDQSITALPQHFRIRESHLEEFGTKIRE